MKLTLAMLSSIGAQQTACRTQVGTGAKCKEHKYEVEGKTLDECLNIAMCDTQGTAVAYQAEGKICRVTYDCGGFEMDHPGWNFYSMDNCDEYDRKDCPGKAEWSAYSAWTTCSKGCGGGTRTQTRSCSTGTDADCDGSPTNTEACNVAPCTKGVWSDWSAWGECSVQCGEGEKFRSRTCSIPPGVPSDNCDGTDSESQMCGDTVCVCNPNWEDWRDAVPSDVENGVSSPCADYFNGGYCTADGGRGRNFPSDDSFERWANGGYTALNCPQCGCRKVDWGNWIAGSNCQKEGEKCQSLATRKCYRDGVEVQGSECVAELGGKISENQNCECPKAVWSEFGDWTDCSVTCGDGSKTRTRTCSVTGQCDGSGTEEQTCNEGACPLGFPCPSTNCWDFRANTGTCELKALDACTKVTCGATSMSMEIGTGVFADSDASMGLVEPALDDATDDGATLGWVKSCDLDSDDCNMSHKVDGNDLIFTVQFSLKGKSRGRSDVEDKIIDLGDVQVNTAPFGIGVSFECTYDMTVDVTSNEFSVQEVTVSGTKAGDGSLEAGFTMSLNEGSSDALVLGSRLNVEVDWSLTLSDIDYYFQGCSVRHASNTDASPTKVAVVKSGCYSEALHATRDTCSDNNGICMSFQTFTIEAEAGTDQIIGCTVQLCNSATADGCNGKTAPTCPAADAAYVYTINGKA